MNSKKYQYDNNDYAKAIAKDGFYIATPIGTSMLPLLRERIDTVKLVAPKDIKENDVLLFLRADGETFVLHRLIKIEENDGHVKYLMCGDNQTCLEAIKPFQVIAKMEGYYKEETYIPVTDPDYQKYVKKRVASRKWRALKSKIARIIKK